jgi:hypothetical protein
MLREMLIVVTRTINQLETNYSNISNEETQNIASPLQPESTYSSNAKQRLSATPFTYENLG